jgi:hypothetical protein
MAAEIVQSPKPLMFITKKGEKKNAYKLHLFVCNFWSNCF